MPLRFFKKKIPNRDWPEETELNQCLSLFDLTMVGIGSIIGSGLFVVTGILARNVAGPAITVSFIIAAAPSLIMGLCYAEFASRVPRVGANYLYTQVSLGEMWAFIVGWNYFIDSLISSAALARSSSEYINSIIGGEVYRFFENNMAFGNVEGIAKFPDFLAVTILILVLIFVVLGAWHSSTFITFVTCIKLTVILFMIVVGIYFANPDNWSTPEKFAPHGITGILTAAAQCLFAFGGVDAVAMASEESSNRNNPSRAIYLALAVSIGVYVTVSTLLTLMAPYSLLTEYAPLANAYGKFAFPAAKYIVSVGALCALLGALLVSCFSATRVVYAMARDGLLPAFFGSINHSRQVPIRAAVFCGTIIVIASLLMDLQQLVQLLSIGMLTSSILLLSGVILTRYQPGVDSVTFSSGAASNSSSSRKLLNKVCPCIEAINVNPRTDPEYQLVPELFASLEDVDEGENSNSNLSEPDERTNLIANVCVASMVVCLAALCAVISHNWSSIVREEAWALISSVILLLLIVTSLVLLYQQPRNRATFPSMVPCVPALPLVSLVVDVILLVNLSFWTYVRFAICAVIGKLS